MLKSIDQIYEYIQQFGKERTLITIGSGISAGEGIPGMRELAKFLLSHVDQKISELDGLESVDLEGWNVVKNELKKGADLERALSVVEVSPVVEKLIVEFTYSLISSKDSEIFTQVFENKYHLNLYRLLKQYIPINSSPLTIITTNYDCLIEYAGLSLGLNIDNLFYGSYFRKFDPSRHDEQHQRLKRIKKNSVVPAKDNNYILLLKPHGSIDWFSRQGGETYLIPHAVSGVPDIITPGKNKWRNERREPFNTIYAKCNEAIDDAINYLFLGYGYNDADLQDHYSHRDNRIKPKLIVTMELNPSLNDLFDKSPSCMLIVRSDAGSHISWKKDGEKICDMDWKEPLWQINSLAELAFRQD
ncbi:SIR2 family protein [Lacticaseibacillus chiayiensis]|uniref:SIR2 family protein n=1 Tax=Lacticaseibacillus chiayiensis TaxID=2100821 RepID=UPI0010135B0F|nr:SIR2 family protein [Lacticaseibacillus chiayiensis]RXT56872.1 hypothetical protein CHT97_10475 [Lacticaseibacillus chiayiensis]